MTVRSHRPHARPLSAALLLVSPPPPAPRPQVVIEDGRNTDRAPGQVAVGGPRVQDARLAADACDGGKVDVNAQAARARQAAEAGRRGPGDVCQSRHRILKVARLDDRRGSATVARALFEDLTPPEPPRTRLAPPPRVRLGAGRPDQARAPRHRPAPELVVPEDRGPHGNLRLERDRGWVEPLPAPALDPIA